MSPRSDGLFSSVVGSSVVVVNGRYVHNTEWKRENPLCCGEKKCSWSVAAIGKIGALVWAGHPLSAVGMLQLAFIQRLAEMHFNSTERVEGGVAVAKAQLEMNLAARMK
jgi:hypothetical protein